MILFSITYKHNDKYTHYFDLTTDDSARCCMDECYTLKEVYDTYQKSDLGSINEVFGTDLDYLDYLSDNTRQVIFIKVGSFPDDISLDDLTQYVNNHHPELLL